MAKKIVVPVHSRVQRVVALPDLGLAVRAARTLGGLRIDTAASLCGVSVALLSALENGTGRAVRTDKLLQVLDNLGLALLVMPKEDAQRLQRVAGHD